MGRFHQARLFTRAVLICALLVFGHLLLTAAASSSNYVSKARLASTIEATSSLVFVTVLWTSFTLIEAVDVGLMPLHLRDEQGQGPILERAWIEFVLNSVILYSWAVHWSGVAQIMNTFSPQLSSEMIVITAAFIIVVLALAALHVQFVASVARHVHLFGHRAIFQLTFWNRKTGHWTERIVLGETVIVALDPASLMDEEKMLREGDD